MNSSISESTASPQPPTVDHSATTTARLDYLDATRAFALLLGIVFHASLSFMPIFFGWAVQDVSTSSLVLSFVTVSHSFRMETFFLIAGFFGHMTFHRKGAASFVISRFLRIVVPFVVGWFILHPLIVSGWTMGAESMRGDYHFAPAIQEGFRTLAKLPNGLFTQTHLWFLYYLAMVTTITLALRGLSMAAPMHTRTLCVRVDQSLRWIVRSPFGWLACAIPTAALLWKMRIWGVDTPDMTLVPQFPVLLLYEGFFMLGWMLHRQANLMSEFGKLTFRRWLIAGVSTSATLYFSGFQMDPGGDHYQTAHIGFVVAYAFMMWTLVRLVIGIFHHLCRKPRAWVRYLADSSYWLYLIHLPIVVWLQVAVADYNIHWSIKLSGITAATVLISLASYDLFVRSTLIGMILNGRRKEASLRLEKWSCSKP